MVHTGGEGGFKRTMDLLGFGDIVRDVGGVGDVGAARRRGVPRRPPPRAPETFRTRPRDEWIKLFHAADLAALPVLRPEEVFADDQVVARRHRRRRRRPGGRPAAPDRPGGALPRQPAAADRPGADRGGRRRPVGRAAGRGRVRTAPAPTRSLGSPLEGVRVLDLSAFFATAYGARLLSDLGADVIKIEPLVGDQMRPLADLFECAQRGKRNLAIDLRTRRGRRGGAQARSRPPMSSCTTCDPGKAEKLGIGYEQCAAINPSLIYCYLPGFGSTGPKANLKSFAPLVSGFTGMLYVGAGDGNPPVRRVVGNEDLYNGYLGAMSVLMAWPTATAPARASTSRARTCTRA